MTSAVMQPFGRVKVGNTLLAAIGGFVLTILLIFSFYTGNVYVSGETLFLLLIVFWLVNFLFIGLLISGVTRNFKDPTLTKEQMYWAATTSLFFMALISDFHEPVYVLIFQIIVFGTLNLTPKEFVTFALYILFGFSIVQYVDYINASHDKWRPVIVWLVFFYSVCSMLVICTALIKLKNRLKTKNEALMKASETKSLFLANMSHELRTPLNGVIGMASILSESKLDTDQANMVKVISTSSNNLLEIINNILDYSKLEAGKLKLELNVINIVTIAKNVIAITSVNAKAKSIEYIHSIDPKIPEQLLGDEFRIKQVLLNLLSNAIKFTDRGRVHFSVTHLGHFKNFDVIRFTISDTGIGISQEQQEKIFQKFSQADSTVTRQYGGTGLGLSIATEIVELFETQIHVESQPGSGSKFWFDLPLKSASLDSVEEKNLDFSIKDGNNVTRLILVVDDDNTNQLVTQKMLEFFGHQTEIAANGQIAVDMCNRKQYDLIFMDCQMPVMDGYTATKLIRSSDNLNQHTTIIALTAHALAGDEQKCIDKGMNAYLAKPIKKEVMEEVLEKFV